jgi:hypothetical protein
MSIHKLVTFVIFALDLRGRPKQKRCLQAGVLQAVGLPHYC